MNSVRLAEEEEVLAAHVPGLALVVVVAGRAGLLEVAHVRIAQDRLDPLGLGGFRDVERPDALLEGARDHEGGVPAGLGEQVREVHGEAGLGDAHDEEEVREAVRVHAVQRAHAVLPLVRQGLAASPADLEAAAPGVGGADLEAAGVDQAVELVLPARGHDAALRDALHSLALRVDERDVLAVEGRQVLVVEARALAELAVVGLERLGRRRVLHDRSPPGRGSLPSSRSPRAPSSAAMASGERSGFSACWNITRSLRMISVQPSFTRSSGW